MNNNPCKVFFLNKQKWQLIWSNLTIENSLIIKTLKVFKETIPHMNLSSCTTSYIEFQ
jgi:hypothetical protein